MDLVQFHQQLRDQLRLTYYLLRQEGKEINVGESFTLRFQLWNDAPAPIGPYVPRIIFTHLSLTVRATDFATPLQDGQPVQEATFSFADSRLPGEETTFVDVNLQAVKHLSGLEDLLSRETVAEVMLQADLDVAQYFRVHLPRTVHEKIAR